MSNASTFGARLKQRRIEHGLTQDELGELAGCAGQTIRRIEGGQRRPSLQLARRLAQTLALDPAEQPAWMQAARAVAMPDAAAPAPQPPRRLAPSPGLPTYLTPFVGREQEQAALAALLARSDVRLVTVLGPGGAGKTRLAIETSRTLPGFADGTAFVSLASVAAPASIVPAIGDALGIAISDASDLPSQVISHLRDRRVLLVLDNLEHVLDPAGVTLGLIERLLQGAEDLTVLATSRERLRLAGEWVLELAGLQVPQPHTTLHGDAAAALTLFVEHAERLDRAFRLTPTNALSIATICRLVDGLPLGIELAASWLRLLTLDEIAHELTRGLDTTPLAPRSLPARHHSLRAVVDQSWHLLSDQERVALSRLSVFHGGFTRVSAAQVTAVELPQLARLVDKSLLRRRGDGRYDLHEIIRQYASARLQEHVDDCAATQRRHAAYFLRSVAEREQRLRSAEQGAALAELSAEVDNIRAAWLWAAAHALLDELEGAGEVLQWFYEFRRWFQDGSLLFAQAIARLRAVEPTDEPLARRTLGRLLSHYGYLLARTGVFVEANDALAESHALLADGRDRVGLARTLMNQGMAAHWVGNYGAARRMLDQSLALATEAGDRSVQGASLTWASIVAHAVGETGEAERLFRAALAHYRAMGDPRAMIWCITFGSVTLLAGGKYVEAELLLRESLALSQAVDDRYGMAAALHNLGRAALEQHKVAEAIALLGAALPLLRTAGSWTYAQAFNDLGAAQWQSGAVREAGRVYREGLAQALKIRAIPQALEAISGLAVCLAHDGQYAVACSLAARILADPASGEASRHRAVAVQRAAAAHLSPEDVAQLTHQATHRSLAEVVAELELPGVSP